MGSRSLKAGVRAPVDRMITNGGIIMASSRGGFAWYELMTTDIKAAGAFYSGVIGWRAADAGMPGMAYTLFHVGDVPVAGAMALPEEARKMGTRPAWMGYVAVEDVDAAAVQFKQDGGTVHREPADIPGVGRFAVVSDPQGAFISLFKPSTEGKGLPNVTQTPGYGRWRELLAVDREQAFAFYSKQFGWTKGKAHDMGPMGIYQLFQHGSEDIGGMMNKPQHVPAPFWLYYFRVDGIHPAAERVRAGGGQVVNGPMEVPGGQWIVQCLDPQGAMFALIGPRG